MFAAFAWGSGAACSLLLGSLLASYAKISRRLLGLIMAFGVGTLISAVSFELAEQAFTTSHRPWAVAAGLAAGALAFFVGDVIIEKMGGRAHRRAGQRAGPGLAILLGTILDGIPESVVIGLALVRGGSVSVAMVVAVFLSNLPEAIGSTSGLAAAGWRKGRLVALWLAVVVVSGAAAWVGYAFFDQVSASTLTFTLTFAAGALLTMVADSMMPEAFRDSGKPVGLVTTLGFGLAFLISMLS